MSPTSITYYEILFVVFVDALFIKFAEDINKILLLKPVHLSLYKQPNRRPTLSPSHLSYVTYFNQIQADSQFEEKRARRKGKEELRLC